MRITITPLVDPGTEIDVTEGIVSAIADQLSRRTGGNAVLNALEPARHLPEILRRGTGWFAAEEIGRAHV